MKILVVYTGGTIGSRLKDNLISPDKRQKSELIMNFEGVEFDYTEPYFILSEQLNGGHISDLIRCIDDNIKGKYDGIIVTHGTDTLQYTAAALSLAFGNCDIPIVLVSSNYILADERANGYDNFYYSVQFIKQGIGGVFVSYRNTDSQPEIHIGSALLAHEIYSDDVKSLGKALGYFQGDSFVQLRDKTSEDSIGAYEICENTSVLWVTVRPGFKPVSTEGYRAVLLTGYHSGTLPTISREFQKFCEKTESPIYFLGANEGKYESTKLFQELGINVLPPVAPIYAFMKLWVACDNSLKLDKDFHFC